MYLLYILYTTPVSSFRTQIYLLCNGLSAEQSEIQI